MVTAHHSPQPRSLEIAFLHPLIYVPIWFEENHTNEPKPILPFTPVPLRARRDGWTVERLTGRDPAPRFDFIQARALRRSMKVQSMRSFLFRLWVENGR